MRLNINMFNSGLPEVKLAEFFCKSRAVKFYLWDLIRKVEEEMQMENISKQEKC